MKIVIFKGGIGNQLFQYCLIDYLSRKGYNVYYRDETFSHNGLEINKYFNVPLQKLPRLADYTYRIIKNKYPGVFAKLTTEDNVYEESKVVFNGYWQDKKYMPQELKICFNKLFLSSKNKAIEKQIESTNSVGIHVRRGDYLNYPEIYGGICTIKYYLKAIETIKGKISTPRFFFFSDDIEWCKCNLNIANAEYIDWNTGPNSIYDLYLMSKCKANIIANSTFSYWGVLIAQNDVVIYPKRWFANNRPLPLFFRSQWIAL